MARRRKRRSRRRAYERYIQSPEWEAFRERILAERGRTCQRCGKIADPPHIHHLHYRNFGHELPADVQVLCEPCHDEIHRPGMTRRFAKWFANSLKYEGIMESKTKAQRSKIARRAGIASGAARARKAKAGK